MLKTPQVIVNWVSSMTPTSLVTYPIRHPNPVECYASLVKQVCLSLGHARSKYPSLAAAHKQKSSLWTQASEWKLWDTAVDVLEPPVISHVASGNSMHSKPKRNKSDDGTHKEPFGRRTIFESIDWKTPNGPSSNENERERERERILFFVFEENEKSDPDEY